MNLQGYPRSPRIILKNVIDILVLFCLGFLVIGGSMYWFQYYVGESPESFFVSSPKLWRILIGAVLLCFLYQYRAFKVFRMTFAAEGLLIRKDPLSSQELVIPYAELRNATIAQDALDKVFGLFSVRCVSKIGRYMQYVVIGGFSKKTADSLLAELLAVAENPSRIPQKMNESDLRTLDEDGIVTERNFPIQRRWLLKPYILAGLIFMTIVILDYYTRSTRVASGLFAQSIPVTIIVFLLILLPPIFVTIFHIVGMRKFRFVLKSDSLGITQPEAHEIPLKKVQSTFLSRSAQDLLLGLASVTLQIDTRFTPGITGEGMYVSTNRHGFPSSEIVGRSGDVIHFPGLKYKHALVLHRILQKRIAEVKKHAN